MKHKRAIEKLKVEMKVRGKMTTKECHYFLKDINGRGVTLAALVNLLKMYFLRVDSKSLLDNPTKQGGAALGGGLGGRGRVAMWTLKADDMRNFSLDDPSMGGYKQHRTSKSGNQVHCKDCGRLFRYRTGQKYATCARCCRLRRERK